MSRHSAKGAAYQRRRRLWLAAGDHGWTCWLCHLPVDPTATSAADRATVDHIVPTSTHRASPLDTRYWRLAHGRCNSARQDAPPPLGQTSRHW